MAEKRVHRIDAALSPARFGLKRQVCAYIRVSTGHEKQLDSLENQRQYYERMITSNPKYEFRGIFSDAGISGAKEERPGFSDMLAQAREGNIDVILTKSISRFARNTVLLLKAVRELKSLGVAVVFEEQHINTLSADGELMLSVLASIAEEERKAVCGNVSWAIRSRYKRGEVFINTNRLLGYDKDENGALIINEEQADIVRTIFERFLSGVSANKIAKELNDVGISTYTNYPWSGQRIRRIVGNEKYMGDCLMQKTFVDERGISVRNQGQIDQYYLSENHPAIVSREDWKQAQKFLKNSVKKSYPFSSRLHCPLCGAVLIRSTSIWGTDWVCGTYLHCGKAACPGILLPEDILECIASEDERNGGHYIVEVIENGAKSKREKTYRLLPYTPWRVRG